MRRVVSVGLRTKFLKGRLSKGEVMRSPVGPSPGLRAAGGRSAATYEFPRGEGRVLVAGLKGGVLVSLRAAPRDKAVGAARFR